MDQSLRRRPLWVPFLSSQAPAHRASERATFPGSPSYTGPDFETTSYNHLAKAYRLDTAMKRSTGSLLDLRSDPNGPLASPPADSTDNKDEGLTGTTHQFAGTLQPGSGKSQGFWLFRVLKFIFCVFLFSLQYDGASADYVCMIEVEVIVNGRSVRRSAMALLDTGCPYDLMSRSFAKELGVVYAGVIGSPILSGFGDSPFKKIGSLEGRWACTKKPRKFGFSFAPKFYKSTWEVSASDNDWFDVIIGVGTIQKYGLLGKPKFAAPGRRYLPEKVPSADAATAKARQDEARKLMDTQIREHKANKAQAAATANGQISNASSA